jgi:hypothetical protein
MGSFINANINAGTMFIRKSKLKPVEGKRMPEYYVEVFSAEGVSLGTTGVWENKDKNGDRFLSGDLSNVSRDPDKEQFVLTKKMTSTDPYEGKNVSTKPEVGF